MIYVGIVAEGLKVKAHLGTHPVFERTCDYYLCWCHKPDCLSKVFKNGEKCDCGNDWVPQLAEWRVQ